MPNIGFGEIVLILLVALIVFGPRKLPEIGRTLGKSIREFRRATSSLKSDIQEGLDEDVPATPSTREKKAEKTSEQASSDHSAPTPEADGPAAGAGPAPSTDPATEKGDASS